MRGEAAVLREDRLPSSGRPQINVIITPAWPAENAVCDSVERRQPARAGPGPAAWSPVPAPSSSGRTLSRRSCERVCFQLRRGRTTCSRGGPLPRGIRAPESESDPEGGRGGPAAVTTAAAGTDAIFTAPFRPSRPGWAIWPPNLMLKASRHGPCGELLALWSLQRHWQSQS